VEDAARGDEILPESEARRAEGMVADMPQLEMRKIIPQNTFKASNPLHSAVLETRLLTPRSRGAANEVRHVVLSAPGLTYLPGQSIGVIPDGYDARTGKPHKLRLYSVSSESKGDYGDWKTVSTVVVRHFWDNEETGEKGVPGVCSKQLCDCEVGDTVRITGPNGRHFLLPPDFHGRDLIFVATGTGIAPYRGMLKEMFDEGYKGNVFLFFGVKYADTVLYDEDFRAYLDRPNFRYLTTFSREKEKNAFAVDLPTPDNKMYIHVRMWQYQDELRPSLAKPDTLVYVCGLRGMERGVQLVLDLIGGQLGEAGLANRLQAERRFFLEVY
jgi:ferredoxin--NADP+ reductase